MKFIIYLLALTSLCSAFLSAASLGDLVAQNDAKATANTDRHIIGSGEFEGIKVSVYDAALTEHLYLPHALRSGRNTKPEVAGYVILYVRGVYTNTNDEKQFVADARFVSASGKIFEGKRLFDKKHKAELFVSLNPDEAKDFIVCFQLPIAELIGGKLLCCGDGFMASDECRIDLNISAHSDVCDKLTREGVTDNAFDAGR